MKIKPCRNHGLNAKQLILFQEIIGDGLHYPILTGDPQVNYEAHRFHKPQLRCWAKALPIEKEAYIKLSQRISLR
jgi:hypothetical protein